MIDVNKSLRNIRISQLYVKVMIEGESPANIGPLGFVLGGNMLRISFQLCYICLRFLMATY